ncbi:MAG: putative PIN and TRAM-domain containing protein YacL [Chlamydiae bacterium]|nr:putative PIN and TRAM-domain containing protein YacL [Chlamydiota bacterium]
MKISIAFFRVLFTLLTLFFMTSFMLSLPLGPVWQKLLLGGAITTLFIGLLFSLETFFKRYSLRAFNTVILGLFFGYFMGQALVFVGEAIFQLTHMHDSLQPQTIDLMKTSFFLLGTYLGCTLTIHLSDEVAISIPFIKFSTSQSKKKDLIIDASCLSDPRVIDLVATGLLDHRLVLPRFILKHLFSQMESGDEEKRRLAKQSIETFRKLQSLPGLGLRFDETQFSEDRDPFHQVVRLARLTNANILTADNAQAQASVSEGIKIISLTTLSIALKPLMQMGESMKIKIQRYGKEPNQGVGYLEDGTMVVINGGGDFIGECIDVQVLSVKHTSSGRMIFCNSLDELPSKGNRIEV